MDKQPFNNPYLVAIHVAENGIIRLCGFIVSFMLWFAAISAVLFLILFDVIEIETLAGLRKLGAYLGWFGIAPIAIVLVSWRTVEWLIAWWITSYRKKHLIIDKS